MVPIGPPATGYDRGYCLPVKCCRANDPAGYPPTTPSTHFPYSRWTKYNYYYKYINKSDEDNVRYFTRMETPINRLKNR